MRVHLGQGRWLVEVTDTEATSIAVPSNDDLINREFDRYTQESEIFHELEGEEP